MKAKLIKYSSGGFSLSFSKDSFCSSFASFESDDAALEAAKQQVLAAYGDGAILEMPDGEEIVLELAEDTPAENAEIES